MSMPEDLSWVTGITSGVSFGPAFLQSFLMIIATEIGDRTFFIAAIMAMRHSRLVVLQGALGALALMTVLSALLGKAFPLLLDKKYTNLAAGALFGYFGLALLRNWWKTRGEVDAENEELAEVEAELLKKDDGTDGVDVDVATDEAAEAHSRRAATKPVGTLSALMGACFSPVFIQAFTLTFIAEWGDRSQIATIALAAAKDIYGVTIGGVLGHALCTTIAVLGGKLLAARISEASVSLFGGSLFLVFAVLSVTGTIM